MNKMPEKQEVLCYNKGCGKMFDINKNLDNSCTYHSGDPSFHDAYKSWSCCSKKCINFTDFLNIPGCCRGNHSNTKSVIISNVKKVDNFIIPKPIEPDVKERPLTSKGKFKLPIFIDENYNFKEYKISPIDQKGQQPIITDICKHNACNITYKEFLDGNDVCVYHSGQPVFHEGCCEKRTTDFTTFLNQIGCLKGKHIWKLEKSTTSSSECKYDWHQTEQFIYVTIYIKTPDPESSYIKANDIILHIYINFYDINQQEHNVFDKTIELYDLIDISQSLVQFRKTKIEIKLKKAQVKEWKSLEFR